MLLESRSGATAPVHAPPPDQADRIAASRHAPPAHVSRLQWQLATPTERHAMVQDRAPTSAPGATGFRGEVSGTRPRPTVDRQLALLANDAYHPMPTPGPTAPQDDGHATTTLYRRELAAAGWQRVDPHALGIDPTLTEDPRSGFRAAIYRNDRNQYVVAFAGTNTGEPGDLKADGGQGIGIKTVQYAHAVAVAHAVQDEVGAGNLAFTGHSLGGGLAATASAATHEPAVTFNAAGVHNETLRGLGYRNPNDARDGFAKDGSIRSYAVAGDPLTTLGVHGAPGQLGSPWTMPLPGGTVNGEHLSVDDPRDLITLHGGADAGQLYVDGLAPDARPLQPGIVETPVPEALVQGSALATTMLAPWIPGGPVLAAAAGGFALLPPEGRGAVLGVAGAAGDSARDLRGDDIAILRRFGRDAAGITRHDDAFDAARLAGAGADAGLDLAGSALHRGADFLGQSTTALGDAAGTRLRDTGHALHLPEPLVRFAARAVEGAGNLGRGLLEAGGGTAARLADGAGNAAAHAANLAARGGEAAARVGTWAQEKAGQLVHKLPNPFHW